MEEVQPKLIQPEPAVSPAVGPVTDNKTDDAEIIHPADALVVEAPKTEFPVGPPPELPPPPPPPTPVESKPQTNWEVEDGHTFRMIFKGTH